MFIDFLYFLRAYGLPVTSEEWLTLMDALDKGLHHSSLLGFYRLAQMILVHSETQLDSFDRAFAAFFKDVRHMEHLPPEIRDWLQNPSDMADYDKAAVDARFGGKSLEELRALLQQRLNDQTERHDKGNFWVGTGGTSLFGHGGYNPRGILTEGEGGSRSALQFAGERHYQDFRGSAPLDIRQFQMAFRKLRRLRSGMETGKTELQLEQTIDSTCKNAGFLTLEYDRPRNNDIRLLLLFDSGGSMWPHAQLCRRLFHAADQSNHFREVRTYYFHNCIYEVLHTTPECSFDRVTDTEKLLQELTPDWKIIFVGDGEMAPEELLNPKGRHDFFHPNELPGLYWLRRFTKKYPYLVWLNPVPEERWPKMFGAETIGLLRRELTMLPLSLDGLETAVKRLLVAR